LTKTVGWSEKHERAGMVRAGASTIHLNITSEHLRWNHHETKRGR